MDIHIDIGIDIDIAIDVGTVREIEIEREI